MLELAQVTSGYGSAKVLHGIDLRVGRGEVVTLLGRNGMGKTTAIATIIGMVRLTGGHLAIDGEDCGKEPDYRRARMGLGLVPEGRRIFPNLSVRENLVATAVPPRHGPERWSLDRVLALFPRLASRLATSGAYLSGGEQQMLAIGRALMTNPWLLLMDEATEGLAPLVCNDIWRALAQLKSEGHAILIVDRNLDALASLADRHYVLEKGRVSWSGDAASFRAEEAVVASYLGVGPPN